MFWILLTNVLLVVLKDVKGLLSLCKVCIRYASELIRSVIDSMNMIRWFHFGWIWHNTNQLKRTRLKKSEYLGWKNLCNETKFKNNSTKITLNISDKLVSNTVDFTWQCDPDFFSKVNGLILKNAW